MPLDTARVRTVLDDKSKPKSTLKTIFEIVQKEGL